MRNVLITGPTGEVGIALISELLAHDYCVTAVIRPNSKRRKYLPFDAHLSCVTCELDELDQLSFQLSRDYDLMFHLGWAHSRDHDNVDFQNKNIQYTIDAVRLAKKLKIKTFIGAGSQAEYGRVQGVLSPETPAYPDTAYGMAKLCAGQMSRLLCQQLAIKHVWPRIFSVYGPGDSESTMIISTIRKLLRGEKPSLTKGEQEWDFLYSSDCARALRLIGEEGKDGSVYCIGSGKSRELRSYIKELRNAIDPSLPLGFGELPYREKQVMYLEADISKLTNDTGFIPSISFQTGIKDTIQWCRMNPVGE